MSLRVLMVGAGAVGATYGYHFARGGARVSYFVRPKYAGEVRSGLTLFRHGPFGRLSTPRVERFQPHAVLSTEAEVAERRFDQVWLTMSSTALRGPWLAPFLAATGDATIFTLQPGLNDYRFLAEQLPTGRLARGLITLIAYQGPLPGERLPPPGEGIAYVLPPGAPIPLSGPVGPVREAVETLYAGGCPAVEVEDVAPRGAVGSGLMPLIAALEISGWSFERFLGSSWAGTGCAGAREAVTIAAATLGVQVPGALSMLRPSLLRAGLWAAPALVPFNLEVYLGYHFDKVGDQTRSMLETFRAEGQRRGLPVASLSALQQALPAR